MGVNCVDVRARSFAGGDVGLVGDDDIEESRRTQRLQRLAYAGKQLQIGKRARRVRLAVAHDRLVDHAVAVEKHRAALRYHFVAVCCRAGCDTRQCQTTAWNASVCGVTRPASTVGISTTQSPTLAV